MALKSDVDLTTDLKYFSRSQVRDAPLFSEQLADLFNKRELSDICLVISNKEYYAHKIILARVSPIFRSLFGDAVFKDTGHVEDTVVQLTECEECLDVFPEFLRYFYSGSICISTDIVIPLLILSIKYKVDSMTLMCLQWMCHYLESGTDTNFDLDVVVKWTMHGYVREASELVKIRRSCLKALKNNIQGIISKDSWLSYPLDIIVSLLKDNELKVEEQFMLFEAVEKWFLYKDRERAVVTNLNQVLPLFRFPMWSPEQIFSIQEKCQRYCNEEYAFWDYINRRFNSLMFSSGSEGSTADDVSPPTSPSPVTVNEDLSNKMSDQDLHSGTIKELSATQTGVTNTNSVHRVKTVNEDIKAETHSRDETQTNARAATPPNERFTGDALQSVYAKEAGKNNLQRKEHSILPHIVSTAGKTGKRGDETKLKKLVPSDLGLQKLRGLKTNAESQTALTLLKTDIFYVNKSDMDNQNIDTVEAYGNEPIARMKELEHQSILETGSKMIVSFTKCYGQTWTDDSYELSEKQRPFIDEQGRESSANLDDRKQDTSLGTDFSSTLSSKIVTVTDTEVVAASVALESRVMPDIVESSTEKIRGSFSGDDAHITEETGVEFISGQPKNSLTTRINTGSQTADGKETSSKDIESSVLPDDVGDNESIKNKRILAATDSGDSCNSIVHPTDIKKSLYPTEDKVVAGSSTDVTFLESRSITNDGILGIFDKTRKTTRDSTLNTLLNNTNTKFTNFSVTKLESIDIYPDEIENQQPIKKYQSGEYPHSDSLNIETANGAIRHQVYNGVVIGDCCIPTGHVSPTLTTSRVLPGNEEMVTLQNTTNQNFTQRHETNQSQIRSPLSKENKLNNDVQVILKEDEHRNEITADNSDEVAIENTDKLVKTISHEGTGLLNTEKGQTGNVESDSKILESSSDENQIKRCIESGLYDKFVNKISSVTSKDHTGKSDDPTFDSDITFVSEVNNLSERNDMQHEEACVMSFVEECIGSTEGIATSTPVNMDEVKQENKPAQIRDNHKSSDNNSSIGQSTCNKDGNALLFSGNYADEGAVDMATVGIFTKCNINDNDRGNGEDVDVDSRSKFLPTSSKIGIIGKTDVMTEEKTILKSVDDKEVALIKAELATDENGKGGKKFGQIVDSDVTKSSPETEDRLESTVTKHIYGMDENEQNMDVRESSFAERELLKSVSSVITEHRSCTTVTADQMGKSASGENSTIAFQKGAAIKYGMNENEAAYKQTPEDDNVHDFRNRKTRVDSFVTEHGDKRLTIESHHAAADAEQSFQPDGKEIVFDQTSSDDLADEHTHGPTDRGGITTYDKYAHNNENRSLAIERCVTSEAHLHETETVSQIEQGVVRTVTEKADDINISEQQSQYITQNEKGFLKSDDSEQDIGELQNKYVRSEAQSILGGKNTTTTSNDGDEIKQVDHNTNEVVAKLGVSDEVKNVSDIEAEQVEATRYSQHINVDDKLETSQLSTNGRSVNETEQEVNRSGALNETDPGTPESRHLSNRIQSEHELEQTRANAHGSENNVDKYIKRRNESESHAHGSLVCSLDLSRSSTTFKENVIAESVRKSNDSGVNINDECHVITENQNTPSTTEEYDLHELISEIQNGLIAAEEKLANEDSFENEHLKLKIDEIGSSTADRGTSVDIHPDVKDGFTNTDISNGSQAIREVFGRDDRTCSATSLAVAQVKDEILETDRTGESVILAASAKDAEIGHKLHDNEQQTDKTFSECIDNWTSTRENKACQATIRILQTDKAMVLIDDDGIVLAEISVAEVGMSTVGGNSDKETMVCSNCFTFEDASPSMNARESSNILKKDSLEKELDDVIDPCPFTITITDDEGTSYEVSTDTDSSEPPTDGNNTQSDVLAGESDVHGAVEPRNVEECIRTKSSDGPIESTSAGVNLMDSSTPLSKDQSESRSSDVGVTTVLFRWNDVDSGNTVQIAGEFTDWRECAMTFDERERCFSAKFNLKEGDYQYKYVIGGEWCLKQGEDIIEGPLGENHVVRITQ